MKMDKKLPIGWTIARLSEVISPRTERVHPSDHPDARFLRMDHIERDSTRILGWISASSMKSAAVRFYSRDVLYGSLNPYLNKVARPHFDGLSSAEFIVFPDTDVIHSSFLKHRLNAADFVRYASNLNEGDRPRVKFGQLAEFQVLIPPRAEQLRIAAKLDALFSELDKGVDFLKKANAQLRDFRQTLLRYAFEGKLTKQWRKENKDSLEMSEQLVARIKQERDATYKQKLHHWKVARIAWKDRGNHGGMPNKPKRPSTTTEVPHDVLQTLSILADSWVWGPLAWMTCGVEYGTAAKSEPSGEVPVLRMGNIRDGMFDWSDLVYTSDEREIQKYSLHDGDVLFNRTNSPELVGKSAVYRGTKRALFAGYLIRINHLRSVVQSDYLSFFLNSAVARQYGRTVKTDGVNQSNISGSKLLSYPFPFCSIEEQCEISRILNKVSSFVEAMENDIVTQIDLATSLRQAILESAFSGRLVAQDPSDEPASVLLGRIRSEREQATTHRSSRNKRQRQANEAAG